MTAARIRRAGLALVARRPDKGLLGGLWGLPGGRCGEGEDPAEAAVRLARDDLGVLVRVDKPIGVVQHAYTHFRITLHGYACIYLGGEPRTGVYVEWRWVDEGELGTLGFPVTDRRLVRMAGR